MMGKPRPMTSSTAAIMPDCSLLSISAIKENTMRIKEKIAGLRPCFLTAKASKKAKRRKVLASRVTEIVMIWSIDYSAPVICGSHRLICGMKEIRSSAMIMHR